jgi:phage terminase small subunit
VSKTIFQKLIGSEIEKSIHCSKMFTKTKNKLSTNMKNTNTKKFLRYIFKSPNFLQKNHPNKNEAKTMISKNKLRDKESSKLERKSFILET